MLQWMGGSSRNVTASRNSTLKRKKQYFEQRKKQAAALESSSNGYACGGCHKEQRSLDVLSLLNLSIVAQECHSLTLDDSTRTTYIFLRSFPQAILNGLVSFLKSKKQ